MADVPLTAPLWGGVGGAMPEAYGANSPIQDPIANLILGAISTAAIPGQVAQSPVPLRTEDLIKPAANLAMMTTLGAGAMPAEANAMRMGIKAYHGSPYNFDKFDLSKIGTGEGAQAYGHGLYFAENPKVAESYRESVSVPPQRGSTGGLIEPDPGKMYEVDINADPEHFLNWDKPNNQQHSVVQAALDKLGLSKEEDLAKAADNPAITQQLREAGVPGFKYLDQGSRMPTSDFTVWAPRVGEKEQQFVVRGPGDVTHGKFDTRAEANAFADQENAKLNPQTHNYVVFDDNLINILRKFGIVGGAFPLGAISSGALSPNEQKT